MLLDVAALIVGGVLLYFGGDWIVDGAKELAGRLDISPLLISMVLIGFGTSAPELFVSLDAVAVGRFDIAVGNVVGSNIANVFLVLSAAAVIMTIPATRRMIWVDGGAAMVAMLVFSATCLDGTVSRLEGAGLVIALLVFLYYRLRMDVAGGITDDDLTIEEFEPSMSLRRAVIYALLGILALPVGAHLFVEGAAGIATALGVSEAAIGLSIVAVGTSLPEMAACLTAACRKESDIAVGNILGSNVFNSAVVIGVAALYVPIQVSPVFVDQQLWIMLAANLAVTLYLLLTLRLRRIDGVIMLILYTAYIYYSVQA